MHSVNENIVNIKAKILDQAQNLIKYVDDEYETGLAAYQVEEDLFKQLMQMGYQQIKGFLPINGNGLTSNNSRGSVVQIVDVPLPMSIKNFGNILQNEKCLLPLFITC